MWHGGIIVIIVIVIPKEMGLVERAVLFYAPTVLFSGPADGQQPMS